MSHENSETIQGPDGLWYNVSFTGWPRILNGPFQHRDVAESAAQRRSDEADPLILRTTSPIGGSSGTPPIFNFTPKPSPMFRLLGGK